MTNSHSRAESPISDLQHLRLTFHPVGIQPRVREHAEPVPGLKELIDQIWGNKPINQ